MLIALLAVHAVLAADDHGLGNGSAGAFTATGLRVIINDDQPLVVRATAGTMRIEVGSTSGFAAGQLVMLHQAQVGPTFARGALPPVDVSTTAIGSWELARISSIGPGLITLATPIERTYDVPGAQVLTVPEFTTVTVPAGTSIAARKWDGASGGIVAFLATGPVKNDGIIDATAAGYRGGTARVGSYSSGPDGGCILNHTHAGEGVGIEQFDLEGTEAVGNGGGGGTCEDSGGGGGGHLGSGSRGGIYASMFFQAVGASQGGSALKYPVEARLVFGGGGGAGSSDSNQPASGAAGGGAVWFRAAELYGSGRVEASGGRPADAISDGAGGAGAGGAIEVRLSGNAVCGELGATGGPGGLTTIYHGAGGGGGGGRILLQAASVAQCSTAVMGGLGGAAVDGGYAANAGLPLDVFDPSVVGEVTLKGTPLILPDGGSVLPALKLTVEAPAAGEVVFTASPCASGTSEPGATIEVSFDGVAVAPVTALATEQWSACAAAPLTNGTHRVATVATSGSRRAGPVGAEFTVRVVDGSKVGCSCAAGGGTVAALLLVLASLRAGRARRARSAGRQAAGR